ncbi:MAG TPA: ABC transporter permease [Candidatus Saccharimonadales bacterium]|nr:ABC transporter permease [Candidatus Saccharimonadales bacterium]
MNLIDIFRRSLRSLGSARARTLLTAFAIAVGAFALTMTLAATNGANNYASRVIKDNFDPSELIVSANQDLFSATDTSTPQEYSPNATSVVSQAGVNRQIDSLSDTDVNAIKAIPGVESVQTNTTLSVLYVTRDGERKYSATVQAYDSYKSPPLLAGSLAGTLAPNAAVLPEDFLSALGFRSPQEAIGKTIRITVQQKQDQSQLLSALLSGNSAAVLAGLRAPSQTVETKFVIAAVSQKPSVLVQPGAELYITLAPRAVATLADTATRGTDSYHKYLTVYAKVTDGTNPAKLAAVQAKVKKLGYGAQSVVDTQKTITQIITILQGIVLVFGLIAIVASIFGVVNTMYISVLQRTREIGLMKALGMRKRTITLLFLLEAGLLGLLGGLIGALAGITIGVALNPTISRLLSIGDARILAFHATQIIGLLVILTVIAMMAGILPARKAAQLDPIEALRTE